jgi:hypothetical protein
MERRNRSLEALRKLYYIDSLDEYNKALELEKWVIKYLDGTFEEKFDLELHDLQKLSELFYKNISFLKHHTSKLKQELKDHNQIKKFFS